MKIGLGKTITFQNAQRYRCKNGKPQPGTSFCYTIRSKGTHYDKRTVIEFRVGKQVIGYQGPGCRLVYDRKDAREFDSTNTILADFVARECIVDTNVRQGKDPRVSEARAMRKALREAAKIAAKSPKKSKRK